MTTDPMVAAALKTLGEHPTFGGEITVRDGRFGPYVSVAKINATLPKGKDPASVTLEEAIQLINERAEKTGKKPSAAKKTAAKKTAKGDGEAKAGAKTKATSATKKSAASTKKASGSTRSKKAVDTSDETVPWDAS